MILNATYEAIMARLMTNITEIKHFDIYFAQDEPNEDESEATFNRPAILFEYDPQEWQSLGNRKQASEATFSLHIISDVIQEVDSGSTPTIRNLGHAHLALLDKVSKWMIGFNGSGFNSISRTGLDAYKPNGQMIKHVMKFKTRLTDVAAVKTLTPATPTQETTIIVLPE